MNSDKFNQYIEKELSFEESFGAGGRKALCEKEQLAWDLHDSAGPAGRVLLGDTLIRNRVSFLRKDVEVVGFARRLVEEGFGALMSKETKDLWDWYYLGICHEFGRGTPVNHGPAAECFRRAKQAGNPYAEYEEIWSARLSGTPAVETIFRLRECSGRLREFASRSAHALAVLEMGPSRELGTEQHAYRILELSNLQHQFYYHAGGTRHLNVRVEKEMRMDVNSLRAVGTPSSALTLFLISEKSRANPTGAESEVWLRKAVHPESTLLLAIAKRNYLREEHLRLIVGICEDNGWQDSDISRFATWTLEHRDDDPEECGT